MADRPDWLTVEQREAPLVVSFPHTGTELPPDIDARCVSPWLARKDADWWIDKLYDFVRDLGATTIHTAISRTVIDVNRDPSGVSLYPGQNTTELVPSTTFDGEAAVAARHGRRTRRRSTRRNATYFEPYHAALAAEIARLRALHPRIALYDCHSIRSIIPRLFPGELPVMNIGTNAGASCDMDLAEPIAAIASASRFSAVINGRFKGGYITRHYGKPEQRRACRADGTGVPRLHARAGRAGRREQLAGAVRCEPMPPISRVTLRAILETCLRFAEDGNSRPS